jgi:hypothetical protein
VLRWEYRPGSALFVVWQQGRESVTPYGDFQFGRDVGGAFDAPATNVILSSTRAGSISRPDFSPGGIHYNPADEGGRVHR